MDLPVLLSRYIPRNRKDWARVYFGRAGLVRLWVDSLSTNFQSMASKQRENEKNNLKLEERDIPGAILPREIPEECNVVQLKRWLLCRGASTSGNKKQLVARFVFFAQLSSREIRFSLGRFKNYSYTCFLVFRVKDYIKSGLASKKLLDPDGGVNIARKKAELGVLDVVEPELTATFPSEAEGFTESLSDLPIVNFKTIWTYMVASLDAKKQLSTAKPLVKGFNFYKSGHVLVVKSINKDNRTYLKSQVLPSMKKTSAYSCFVILKKQGFVERAYCGCPAGVDGRCNHVAATLFCLEEFCKVRAQTSQNVDESACTSNPCKWNVPRKRKGDVVPISQMKFLKFEHGKEQEKKRVSTALPNGYDVRAPHQRNTSNTKIYEIYSKVKQFEAKNKKVLGLSHILQQSTPKELCDAVRLDHCYSLNCNTDVLEQEPDNADVPVDLISPIKYHPVPLKEIHTRCEKVKKALFVNEEKAKAIEVQTRNQSASQEWYLQRKFRITASKSYRCAALKPSTSPTKALREVLGYNDNYASEAMKAGISKEQEIISQYITEKSKSHDHTVTVERCGFFVNLTHPFLGASPDGLVTDNGESGLLELKFIQTFQSETVEQALIRKRICFVQNEVHLNTKHKYFYQVQHQMYVTGKTWCDFVVKGSSGGPLFIERVYFNQSFWDTVLGKLDTFFHLHMLPEIAYPSVKYGAPRLNLRGF